MIPVLVLCDDVWHPAEVIERGLSLPGQSRYSFDFVRDARDIVTPQMAEKYPLILSCKSNNITSANSEPWFEENVTAFGPREMRGYIENGGSMLFIHSANAYSPEKARPESRFSAPNQEYINLVGNVFHGHPQQCPVTYTPVSSASSITIGVSAFTEPDEQYQCELIADDAEVFLLSSTAYRQDIPAGYIRHIGNGNLIVLTPGHTLAVWSDPNWQKLLQNSFEYCLKRQR